MEGKRYLIVGSNVRNVAESARKAGYEVYVLTKHADADLRLYAKQVFRIEDESGEWVRKRALELSESLEAEIIWASGYEEFQGKSVERVVNKRWFYAELDRIGIDYPELLSDGERGILKPEKGGGGEEVRIGERREKGFILQRYIPGTPCSVSVISTGEEAKGIAVNRMLVGLEEFNATGFRYCGNITPFKSDAARQMVSIAEELVLYFELTGNVGVDFILADKPYVLEINPRFQGSLDSIEWACDCNLFRMHVNAVEGKLSDCRVRRFAGRAVVFADRDVKIGSSPIGNPFFADIPVRGARYRKDDPLVSVLASGGDEEDVMRRLVERERLFTEMIA
ncbi:putative ATP-dependent carboligase related to biotin carboxylase [Geoglobus ahangari]|uniref:Putative ATP-dependent carboligase related to biotin carboxylase n=1 Tax=Geoglobus ahangari TaxID=113653 RepID=A0A0F7IHR5_9EURY|nr:ATP-grasp domain-containing protein [Geoglobus ahangari]AKG92523.1 putative ATP-dependent carboligase related to biotin carboxylase [Geoglobus ahangari]